MVFGGKKEFFVVPGRISVSLDPSGGVRRSAFHIMDLISDLGFE